MDEFFDNVSAKWAKIKAYFIRIKADWTEGRKARAVGKVILPLLPVALVGFIVNFVVKNLDTIALFFIVVMTFLCIVGGLLEERAKRKRAEAERREQEHREAIRKKAQTQDRIYQKMAKAVWTVARELGPLGIVPPNRLGDIYSPGRIIPKRDGEVLLGLYLLQKSRDDVDTDLLISTMQTKLDQKFAAGDFPDIDERYDGLVIDRVKDSIGFVEVYTSLFDESYRRYKSDGDLDRDIPSPSIDRRDMDY